MVKDNLLENQQRVHGVHSPRARALEGMKSRRKVILRMNFTTWSTHAENTHRHTIWRFAGNDDRENLVVKIDKLS